MTTFTTATTVHLDEEWVDAILVTAFDAHYGGSNYWWSPEEGAVSLTLDVNETHPDRPWAAVNLTVKRGSELDGLIQADARPRALTGRVDQANLSKAWAHVVDERPIRSDLVDQLVRSQVENDIDVDADAADCLVQIALFGQVVYG